MTGSLAKIAARIAWLMVATTAIAAWQYPYTALLAGLNNGTEAGLVVFCGRGAPGIAYEEATQ